MRGFAPALYGSHITEAENDDYLHPTDGAAGTRPVRVINFDLVLFTRLDFVQL